MSATRMESGCIMIKAAPPKWSETYNGQLKIKTWGSDNLYPQNMRRLIENSPNGSLCCSRFSDFIFGRGFAYGDDVMMNREQSVNDLYAQVCKDVAMFGGFALHLRYDGLGSVYEVRCLPLETLRLGEDDDLGYFRDVVYCPDWSGETTRNKKNINPSRDNTHYYRYAEDVDVTLARMGENPESYSGEVLFVSNRIGYPKGRSLPIATALSSDEGIQNTLYRNCRTSFAPSGMTVFLQQSQDGTEEADKDFRDQLAALQGDENTGSMLAVSVQSMEDAPKFVPFEVTNYDKKLEATAAETKEVIYSAYKQESFYLLRQGKIGFGGDVLTDAYKMLSLEVESEQKLIVRAFKKIAKRFDRLQGFDFTVRPLAYVSEDAQSAAQVQPTNEPKI